MERFTEDNFVDHDILIKRDAAVYRSTYYHLIDLPFADDGLGIAYGEGLPSKEQLSLANKFASSCNERFFSLMDIWVNEYRLARYDLNPDAFDAYQHICKDNIRNHYGLYNISIQKDKIGRNGNNFVILALRTDWCCVDSEIVLNITDIAIRCIVIQYNSSAYGMAFSNNDWADSEQAVSDYFGGVPWSNELGELGKFDYVFEQGQE